MKTLNPLVLGALLLGPDLATAQDDPVATLAATTEGAFDDEGARVVTTLISGSVSDSGDRLQVGVVFDIDPEWHIYWKNPGQTGLSTAVTFTAGGETSGVELWPAPSVFQTDDGFITSFGYEGQVLLSGSVLVPAGADEVHVTAAADYLVCDSTCIPGRNEMQLVAPVATRAESEAESAFAVAEAAVPVDASELGWSIILPVIPGPLLPGESVEVLIALDTGPESEGLPSAGMLRPDEPARMIAYERIEQVTVEPLMASHTPEGRRGVLLTLRLTAGADPVAEDQLFSGVFLVSDRTTRRALRIEFPIPRNHTETE